MIKGKPKKQKWWVSALKYSAISVIWVATFFLCFLLFFVVWSTFGTEPSPKVTVTAIILIFAAVGYPFCTWLDSCKGNRNA